MSAYQTKEDRDALLKAINEEYSWEYQPFLPLERSFGPVQAPEVGVLYRPTLADEQMWFFPKMELLPIETIEMRIVGGTMVMLGHNAGGVTYLFEQGWKLAENALRKEGVQNVDTDS